MRWLGWLVVASYLFAGCFLLPWAGEVKDKAEQTGQALAQVGVHPANDHACGCGPSDPDDPPTVIVEPCDEGGKYKSDGEYLCCATCHAVCGRKPYTEPAKRKKPPIPVPLPPDCDETTHCHAKEECAIGGGKCCSNCKQACL